MNRNLIVIITLLFSLSSFSYGEQLAEKPMKKIESKKVNSNQLKKVKKQSRKVKGVLPSFSKSEIELIDVRRPGEYNAEHIEGVENIPLDSIFNSMDKYEAKNTYHLHCQSGYRSVIAASILKANGINKIVNINGGIKLIKETTDFNYVTSSCSSNA